MNREIFASLIEATKIVLMTLTIFVHIIAIFEYVCKSLFLYKIAYVNNMKGAWIAWIPILHDLYLGEVAGNLNEDEKFKENYTCCLLLGAVLYVWTLLLNGNSILAVTGVIIIIIYEIMAFYKIYKACIPDLAILFTIFSIINPVGAIIEIIFICHKNWYTKTVKESSVQEEFLEDTVSENDEVSCEADTTLDICEAEISENKDV